MYDLFERYVLVVLQQHFAARGLQVLGQKTVHVGHGVSFQIDIVIQDIHGQTLLVLDTKYKNNHTPKSDDVQQAVAYAEALGCSQAALIYPTLNKRNKPMTLSVGQKQVHRLGLDLAGDLDTAARGLCEDIAGLLGNARATHTASRRAFLTL
jgi:5-methylcytosine-specific restriction endonuclease McrBC regulatory subunit McrC